MNAKLATFFLLTSSSLALAQASITERNSRSMVNVYGARFCALRNDRPTCSSSKKITVRSRGENHGSGSPSCGQGKMPFRYASRNVSTRRSSPIATTSLGA